MIEIEVISKTLDAEDIFRFELARPDGAALPAFGAGAHIDVHLPNGLVRQYSLCNHPEESHRYEIGVLKDPSSRGGSAAMHEQVQAGDRLQISEPRNHFPLAHEAARSLLFAGGIGVTPILCMAERLAHSGSEFEMHYCTRSESRTAFRQRIADSGLAKRVQFHFDDGDPTQKLDAASLLARPETGTHIYVCGPKGFMDHVLDTAERQGWPADQVHREYFAAAPVNHDADAAFEIQLGSSGQILEVPADKSALQVLLEQDIDIPYSCEDGVCGTCLTRVLEGEPDHRDLFMEPAEHAANDQFTPCCSRAKSKRLVLDI
ncbi:PDR/VanB family oxidoreductase [Marinobacterium rhizophilum]|uniref:PDR/VanB family oxidoreductase n=1 Tax=Marinobacterium rhizophilum TaxID=420402 RepID=UPI000377BD4D|nr:PDR/VanB family oxidoreductase [Marinobacterium rhizophilum]